MESICEIRIPTYKRPDWLRRALTSALGQDYPSIRVIVLEDSPQNEGKDVVASFNDPRVIYQPNSKNLGCAGNTDLAFSSIPMAGGEYFTVLDDDNWLYPEFVSANINSIKSSGCLIVLRNQQIWHQGKGDPTPTDLTTRGGWFTEGTFSPMQLQARLFFSEGISHGGMFWHKDARSNLQVGPLVTDAGLAEHCRTLQVIEPIYFGTKPLAAFALMVGELRIRSVVKARKYNRARQAILRQLIQRYGEEVMRVARGVVSHDAAKLDQFHLSQLDALDLQRDAFSPGTSRSLKQVFKGIAKILFVENPLKEYLRSSSPLKNAS
jgi:glycosyltransferase involved in cell wall biosynthesis